VYEGTTPQGTATLTVNATTLAYSFRYFDPYGNARGNAPSTWPDQRTFLDKPTDPTTGLDLLGAREYDPVTGHFLSLDPLLEIGDQRQMNGYSYSGDDPVNSADPTGQRPLQTSDDGDGGTCTPGVGSCDGPSVPSDPSAAFVPASVGLLAAPVIANPNTAFAAGSSWGSFWDAFGSGMSKTVTVGLPLIVFVKSVTTANPTAGPAQGTSAGSTPDYSKFLVVTPTGSANYGWGDTLPRSRQDCLKGVNWVMYMPLDSYNRATGVQACLTSGGFNYTKDDGTKAFPFLGTEIVGTKTSSSSTPPGYVGGGDMARGHLLANRLGGSGTDLRNLVPLYENVNLSTMKIQENKVIKAVDQGHTVWFYDYPVYNEGPGVSRAGGSGPLGIPAQLMFTWADLSTGKITTVPIANVP